MGRLFVGVQSRLLVFQIDSSNAKTGASTTASSASASTSALRARKSASDNVDVQILPQIYDTTLALSASTSYNISPSTNVSPLRSNAIDPSGSKPLLLFRPPHPDKRSEPQQLSWPPPLINTSIDDNVVGNRPTPSFAPTTASLSARVHPTQRRNVGGGGGGGPAIVSMGLAPDFLEMLLNQLTAAQGASGQSGALGIDRSALTHGMTHYHVSAAKLLRMLTQSSHFRPQQILQALSSSFETGGGSGVEMLWQSVVGQDVNAMEATLKALGYTPINAFNRDDPFHHTTLSDQRLSFVNLKADHNSDDGDSDRAVFYSKAAADPTAVAEMTDEPRSVGSARTPGTAGVLTATESSTAEPVRGSLYNRPMNEADRVRHLKGRVKFAPSRQLNLLSIIKGKRRVLPEALHSDVLAQSQQRFPLFSRMLSFTVVQSLMSVCMIVDETTQFVERKVLGQRRADSVDPHEPNSHSHPHHTVHHPPPHGIPRSIPPRHRSSQSQPITQSSTQPLGDRSDRTLSDYFGSDNASPAVTSLPQQTPPYSTPSRLLRPPSRGSAAIMSPWGPPSNPIASFTFLQSPPPHSASVIAAARPKLDEHKLSTAHTTGGRPSHPSTGVEGDEVGRLPTPPNMMPLEKAIRPIPQARRAAMRAAEVRSMAGTRPIPRANPCLMTVDDSFCSLLCRMPDRTVPFNCCSHRKKL